MRSRRREARATTLVDDSAHKLAEGFVEDLCIGNIPVKATRHPFHHLNTLQGGRLRVLLGLLNQGTFILGEDEVSVVHVGNKHQDVPVPIEHDPEHLGLNPLEACIGTGGKNIL